MQRHLNNAGAETQPRKGAVRHYLRMLLTLTLLITGGSATTAQAESEIKHFLGRTTGTEYIFDTPLPKDLAEMLTATGQKYSAFKNLPRVTGESVDGRNQVFISTDIGWDGDRIDQGTIAFLSKNGIESGAWFTMESAGPEWKELASRIKSQAIVDGNWRSATLQVLATMDDIQPPLRRPIPELIQLKAKMATFDNQTRAGMFYPSVQIPANLDVLRTQMLAYGNVGRKDPDFRKKHGAKTATDLSGDTVRTLGGIEKVFKQNRTPPWFADSALDDKLNQAAQFQAEYQAYVDQMGHDGPGSFTDPRTGRSGNMRDLGARADFFEIPRNIVEAAGGGNASNFPHEWMASDTHFRPWFNVYAVYPTLGYGAAKSAGGKWYFAAVATALQEGVMPGSQGAPASSTSSPAVSQEVAASSANQSVLSLRSHNFPDRFIRHRDSKGFLDPVASDLDRKDSTFNRVGGLADSRHISLESVNYPNFFLVAEGENVVLRQRPPNDPRFDVSATFIQQPGLADGSKLSLESYAQRGAYLRHTAFVLYVHPPHDSDLFKADATFEQMAPWCTGSQCR